MTRSPPGATQCPPGGGKAPSRPQCHNGGQRVNVEPRSMSANALQSHLSLGRMLALWLASASFLTAPAHAVQVDLKISIEGYPQATIQGTCNLPDGMLLIVRVTR